MEMLRAIGDATAQCIVEINEAHERMEREQDKIRRLKSQSRAVLKQTRLVIDKLEAA